MAALCACSSASSIAAVLNDMSDSPAANVSDASTGPPVRLRLTEAAPPPSVRWCRGLPSCRRRSATRRCSNRQGEQLGVAEKQSKSRGCGTADLHRRSRPTGIVIDGDRVPERDVGGRPFLGHGPIVLRASKRFSSGRRVSPVSATSSLPRHEHRYEQQLHQQVAGVDGGLLHPCVW